MIFGGERSPIPVVGRLRLLSLVFATLGAFVILAVGAAAGNAQPPPCTDNFMGTSGDWGNPNNWSNGVPTASSVACWSSGTTVVVSGGDTATAESFQAGGLSITGGNLALAGPDDSTVTDFSESGGTLNGPGALLATGGFSWTGGQLSVSSPIAVTQSGGGTFSIGAGGSPVIFGGSINTSSPVSIANTQFSASSSPSTLTTTNTVTLAQGNYPAASPLTVTAAGFNTSGNTSVGFALVQAGGTTDIASGTTLTTNSLTLSGGTLKGTGTVSGPVVNNAGTVAPGESPGTLTISGDYSQGSAATLSIAVNGATSGQYSVLNVGGNVTLDGKLSLLPSTTYAASAVTGDTISFLPITGSRTGTFATTTVTPPLAAQKPFTADYSAANLIKAVVGQAGQQAVSGVSPSSGAAAGGTQVTITGTNLTGATGVSFGGTAATNVSVVNDTTITATSPSGSGTVDVTVTTPAGTSPTNANDQFAYAPTVTNVSPSSGPAAGGTQVTITGASFTGTNGVSFGSTPATNVTVVNDSTITANAPAGTGTVDVTVTTPAGTSPTGQADRFTYIPAPTVTNVNPPAGPPAGGTQVTITGTNFTGASGVKFGSTAAASFTVNSDSQITASSPTGFGTVDVTITTPSGTSATGAADQFSYNSLAPVVFTGSPTVKSTSGAAFSGSVNPLGLPTTAYFEYGLDSAYNAAGNGPSYTQSTPVQQVGSDLFAHAVSATVSGLVPNALYHVRLVASNGTGTTFGPDQTFLTKKDLPPPPPVLGKSFDAAVVSGLVLVKIGKGVFIPLTEARALPPGTEIDARRGTITLVTATGERNKTQTGTFSGGVFVLGQASRGVDKGLTTLSLLEGAFPGGPTYASCKAKQAADGSSSPVAHAAGLSSTVLQTLHASAHGHFRTRGRYSAATVRGTAWTTTDRCDGTRTTVQLHTVAVTDFVRHITVLVHAGQSYLAKAPTGRHK